MVARFGATFVVWAAWATVLVTLILQADLAEDNVLWAIVSVSAAAAIGSLFIWIGDMRRAGMRRREYRQLRRDEERPGTPSGQWRRINSTPRSGRARAWPRPTTFQCRSRAPSPGRRRAP